VKRRDLSRKPTTTARHRRLASRTPVPEEAAPTAQAIPAVLPVIVAEAHGDDLVITLDGKSDRSETVARAGLGEALARLVAELGVATRVELHEADGRVLVDILNPPAPVEAPHLEAAKAGGSLMVGGGDFMPGEAVAVAVVIDHVSADADGHVSGEWDPAATRDEDGAEVLLVGRISHTVVTQPAARPGQAQER